MKHGTKISWTHFPGYKGETWNPILGCSKASPGCANCYAEIWAARLKAMRLEQYQYVVDADGWTGKTALAEHLLYAPSQWTKPRAIFVCSMSDLFHENVPGKWINEVWLQMINNKDHLFIVLTKRPQGLLAWTKMKAAATAWPEEDIWPSNILLGVTAENQEQADIRIPLLQQVPCVTRFVSVEPMLGPVSLAGLDWVICGAESGTMARPMDITWARSLRDQCLNAQIPFYMKQICDHGNPIEYAAWALEDQIRQFPCLKI